MSKTASVKAIARSYGAERSLTFVTGLVALLAGAAVLVLGFGWLGTFRAQRPVLDPEVVDWIHAQQPVMLRVAAIVLGLVLLVFGLWLAVRSLRPEHKPDMALDRTQGHGLTVTAAALAGAVQSDAEAVDGVTRARVRSVGDDEDPALRLHVWLREGTDLRRVWQDLDTHVLARARTALGVEKLPVAMQIELGSSERKRVR
ncbi:alkaline shock response membrane anchor protein AmaP [Prauserella cavernicola]|uniref:Alkaline shock response membrane anchor protein AmaP n=1 Tax=Prauserella cavernicola TaxID=2800127 RepID=A0A934QNC7_9PSEU|nr:alkaline shock response membrane anchor protein AmaP [Prauserella cavernicola]MBK1783375.1 alkaline shock response membrane anchor protein AmaP [Prauserella cavernicola]